MKRIEVRRHSVRDRPQESLSEAGIRLARDVGAAGPRYRIVVSSPVRRALETAAAMGLSVNLIDPIWGDLGELPWPRTFSEYRELTARDPEARRVAERLRSAILEILPRLQEGEAALVLTHGGLVELAVASWVSPNSTDALGGASRCMEGVRLSFSGHACSRVESLRVPGGRTRI